MNQSKILSIWKNLGLNFEAGLSQFEYSLFRVAMPFVVFNNGLKENFSFLLYVCICIVANMAKNSNFFISYFIQFAIIMFQFYDIGTITIIIQKLFGLWYDFDTISNISATLKLGFLFKELLDSKLDFMKYKGNIRVAPIFSCAFERHRLEATQYALNWILLRCLH